MKEKNTDEVTLTSKEERFCYEYVLRLNATKAAINAQYGKKTARQAGLHLLTKANIRERIDYLKNNLAEASGISMLRILKEHEKIAFDNSGKLWSGWITLEKFNSLTLEQKATIQNITTRETKNGTEVKIKIYDKQTSLGSINDILRHYTPKNVPITEKDPFEDMTDEELDARIEMLEKVLNLKK
jgi:phage terminase small subunit